MLRCLKTGNVLCRFVSYASLFMCKIFVHHIDDASSFMFKICAPRIQSSLLDQIPCVAGILSNGGAPFVRCFPICGLTSGASDSLNQVVCLGELKVGFRGGYE